MALYNKLLVSRMSYSCIQLHMDMKNGRPLYIALCKVAHMHRCNSPKTPKVQMVHYAFACVLLYANSCIQLPSPIHVYEWLHTELGHFRTAEICSVFMLHGQMRPSSQNIAMFCFYFAALFLNVQFDFCFLIFYCIILQHNV